jgi:hypothetical protein
MSKLHRKPSTRRRKLKNYRVEIYIKNKSGIFLPSYDCLDINENSI